MVFYFSWDNLVFYFSWGSQVYEKLLITWKILGPLKYNLHLQFFKCVMQGICISAAICICIQFLLFFSFCGCLLYLPFGFIESPKDFALVLLIPGEHSAIM